LFECTPWYAQPIAALAEIADSVCVSVYKGLGGLAGAVLAGPAPLISQARVWQHRHGGRLHSLFPLARAASVGLQRHLPRIPEYVANARALARALSAVPALSALPAEPCINAFQLHFHDVQPERLQRLHRLRAAATGSWLFNWFQPSTIPGATFVDVVMGDALDHWSIAAAAAAIRDLASDVAAP
jgi:threonine aldolase